MQTTPSAETDDRRTILEAFARALRRDMDVLQNRPELAWQQLYNPLQWVDGPEKDEVVSGLLEPELEKRSKPGAGLWLHSLTRHRESEALSRTLSGHTYGSLDPVVSLAPKATPGQHQGSSMSENSHNLALVRRGRNGSRKPNNRPAGKGPNP